MNKKKLILNSGFSYKELLVMKRNFQAMRKQNYDPDEPILEDEDLKAHILFIAESSSSWASILFLLTIVLTVGQYSVRGNIKSPAAMLLICLPFLVHSIYAESKELGLNMATIIKLIALHYRAKVIILREKFN